MSGLATYQELAHFPQLTLVVFPRAAPRDLGYPSPKPNIFLSLDNRGGRPIESQSRLVDGPPGSNPQILFNALTEK